MSELKPCPCGKTPERLNIADANQGGKWANADGNCCGWTIEFRTMYNRIESEECMALAIEEWNDMPRASPWIPCKDRLPETGVKVLATYKNEYGKRRRVIAVRYEQYQRETNHDNDDIESEYCEEKDEYFWPAGWYEQIDNWGEYSDVFIGHDITHWQPLPAPPDKDEA